MVCQLGAQRPLEQRLLQLLEQAFLAQQVIRLLVAGQKLVKMFWLDWHRVVLFVRVPTDCPHTIFPTLPRVWNEVVPFFAYPPQIRKMIYTTNAIESLHRGLRKIIKTRGAFPSDEAATKLLYLALRNLGVHWKPAIEWRAAYAQFTIFFAERLPTTLR